MLMVTGCGGTMAATAPTTPSADRTATAQTSLQDAHARYSDALRSQSDAQQLHDRQNAQDAQNAAALADLRAQDAAVSAGGWNEPATPDGQGPVAWSAAGAPVTKNSRMVMNFRPFLE